MNKYIAKVSRISLNYDEVHSIYYYQCALIANILNNS